MKEPEELYIKYIGYQKPNTEEELQMELLGLETAIAAANSRISTLRQSQQLLVLMRQSLSEAEPSNEETVEPTPTTDETE